MNSLGVPGLSGVMAKKKMQMAACKKQKFGLAASKPKSDKGEECELILEDMDAYTLDEQMAAVKYQRKHGGVMALLSCKCGNSDAEDILQENLMKSIEEATAGLDNKDFWPTWMRLYRLMQFAITMGWQEDPAYEAAEKEVNKLQLSMDDEMDLDKVEVTDQKSLDILQKLFDTCSVPNIDGETPLNRIKINKVEQIFHEQTRGEYLLKRQQLVQDLKDDPNYERITVPSQQVSLAGLTAGHRTPVNPDYNEFYLFHGTSDTVANLIADSDFLIKSSADNGWTFGKGVYAAEWVSHAQMFAMMGNDQMGPDAHGELTVLVCRAFAGRCQRAGNWPNTATPCGPPSCPTPATLEANIASGEAHSTTGSEWPQSGFTVHDFVIPDDDQIMPEFICHCTF